jgi:predicted 2-oxoglutarate/Fe(II)-dependent dioxygenase YbiX
MSNILQCNRKVFSVGFVEEIKRIHALYCILENINSDSTLLNYYEDTEEYKRHRDDSVFSATTMMIKDAEAFEGGDLFFHGFDIQVEKKHNRFVLFPGALEHSVTPIKMNTPYTRFGGDGRYAITQFMNVK